MAVREDPFPVPVRCISDLPARFQEAIDSTLRPDEPIHSILVLPAQSFLKAGGVPRQALLAAGCGLLHVWDGNPPIATYLPAENLLYVRQTLILLYGKLELIGETNSGRVQILAEYNTVGQYLVDALLRHFLDLSYGQIETGGPYPDQNNYLLERLSGESYKFMSGLRLYALQPGEQLLEYIFQPRINKQLFRFISRTLVPASLFALTDKAVILIEEAKSRVSSYGWLITLCPRNVVRSIESQPVKDWERLCVHMMLNQVSEDRNLLLGHEKAGECKSFWASQCTPKCKN